MSITTYSELQTAIGTWSHRADLTSVATDFITLAEARLNRELRVSGMESSTAISASSSVALPTDFLEARSLYVDSNPYSTIEYVSPEFFTKKYNTSNSGVPKVFTIKGGNIQIAPSPDTTYTLNLTYYAKIPALSVTNTTNWLLTNNPDVYLWACLHEVGNYANDLGLSQAADAKLNSLIGMMKSSDKGRWSGNSMRVVSA